MRFAGGNELHLPGFAGSIDNAPEHAGPNHDGSLEDELALLVVHGILHLLGLDHHEEAEAEEMETRERDLLARFHVSAGRPAAAEAG